MATLRMSRAPGKATRAVATQDDRDSGVLPRGSPPGEPHDLRLLACAIEMPRLTGKLLREVGLRPDVIDIDIRRALGAVMRGEPIPAHERHRLQACGMTLGSWWEAAWPHRPPDDRACRYLVGLALQDLRDELAPEKLRWHAHLLECRTPLPMSIALADLVLTGRAPGEGA